MIASLLVRQASFLDLCPITAAAAALARGGCADALDLCLPIEHQAVAGKIDGVPVIISPMPAHHRR